MIQTNVFHHVVTLRVGQGIIGFAQVPLTGEISVVAAGLEYRGQGPLSSWQATALALHGHGSHPAAIGDTPGLHGCAARCAAWLSIKRVKSDPFCRQLIDVGRRHSSTNTTAIRTEVAIASVVGDDKQDIGFFRLSRVGKTVER